jgi:hypothetical protein
MLISLACSNATSNHQDACNHALEAGARQSQLYTYGDKTENYITAKIKNEAGEDVVYPVTMSAFIYRGYRNKEINFKIPTFGVCDSATNQVGINHYSLNLKWNVW